MPAEEFDPVEQSRMSFGEHLEELRSRLVWAIGGFMITFIVCFSYNEKLIELACDPLFWVLTYKGFPAELFPRRVTEVFFTSIKMSAIAAAIISSPWIMYQIWAFIAAGLYPHERRVVYAYAPLSMVCFVAGAVFFYLFVLPVALNYFVSFGNEVEFRPQSGPPKNIRWLFEGFGEQPEHRTTVPPPVTVTATDPVSGKKLDLSVPAGDLRFQIPVIDGADPSEENGWTFPSKPELKLYAGLLWYNSVSRKLRIAVDETTEDPNTWYDRAKYKAFGTELAPSKSKWTLRTVSLQANSALSQAFTLDDYVSFFAVMTLLFGLAFQVPLVVLFSIKIGFVQRKTLGGIRKYIFFAAVIAAAIITPTPDPMTQLMLAVPMYLLYELGLLLSLFMAKPVVAPVEPEPEERPRRKRPAAEPPAPESTVTMTTAPDAPPASPEASAPAASASVDVSVPPAEPAKPPAVVEKEVEED